MADKEGKDNEKSFHKAYTSELLRVMILADFYYKTSCEEVFSENEIYEL